MHVDLTRCSSCQHVSSTQTLSTTHVERVRLGSALEQHVLVQHLVQIRLKGLGILRGVSSRWSCNVESDLGLHGSKLLCRETQHC